MDDADVDLAVDGIVWSAFGTTGQRCTAASRVIVHRAVYEELQTKLVAAAERLRLGPGWEDATDVGPLINREALDKVHSYLQTGITYINAGTTGAEVHLPFGGTKETGNGHREAGQAALDVFTEWKSIYVDYSGKLQRAQIDNQERPAPR